MIIYYLIAQNIKHYFVFVKLRSNNINRSSLLECIVLAKDEYRLAKNTLLKILPNMKKTFELKFEIRAEKVSRTWANAIHITTGSDCSRHGDRIPGV